MVKKKPIRAYVGHTAWGVGASGVSSGEPERRRRPRQEIDDLIIEAARALFAANGYAGTTVREVAERAGVYEPMVYRRFPSKEDLFKAAVIAPLDAVAQSLLAGQPEESTTEATDQEWVSDFVEPLYSLLVDNREAWIAIAMGQGMDRDSSNYEEPPEVRGTRWLFDRLMPPQAYASASESLREQSPPTALVVLGMLLGTALLHPYLSFVSQGRLTKERITAEMIRVCLHGVSPELGGLPLASDAESLPAAETITNQLVLDLVNRITQAEQRAIRAEIEAEHNRPGNGDTARDDESDTTVLT